MKEKLKNLISENEELKHGGLLGIYVADAASGEMLYGLNEEKRMHPASNMKLLTAAAALNLLGPNYAFSTELRQDGRMNGKNLEGNIYLMGKGDPTLQVADLAEMAHMIKGQGIRQIDGDLIGDDTWYDDVRLSSDVVWTDEQYYYGAQVSALTVSPTSDFDTGSTLIEVRPSEVGKHPTFRIVPDTDFITVENEARTVEEEIQDELIVEREHGGNRITIKGKISRNAEPVKEYMSVWGASEYVLHLFASELSRVGITIKGCVRLGRVKENSVIIHSRPSPPLSELLIPFMKLSNNGIGEMLVKEMGRREYAEGSWDKGLEALIAELGSMGMERGKVKLKDGSGLSHGTLISPRQIVHLLYEIQNEEWYPEFEHSLPIAGRKDRYVGGTLKDRMAGYPVKAKTGTIEGVSTLSGYMENASGKKLIFSIMLNNLLDEENGKSIEDDIIRIIYETS